MSTDTYEKARQRVKEVRGFYTHCMVYVAINLLLLLLHSFNLDEGESFWQIKYFLTPIFWGQGLLFHGFNVFKVNPLFSKRWEERMIRKIMEKEKNRDNHTSRDNHRA